MASATTFKSATLRPLTGPLDVGSSIDELAAGAFRWKQNLEIDGNGKLSRSRGFAQPFSVEGCDYTTNHDFHDQGLGVSTETREPVTLLFSSVDNGGVRRLFLGTKTRLGVLDETTGVWNMFATITNNFGNDGSTSLTQTRWHAAELKNKVYFTNNLDLIQCYDIGSNTLAPVADLAIAGMDNDGNEDVPVTKAKVIVSWRGFIWLMNTEEGGDRIASRIRWSDLNDGQRWNPNVHAPDTTAADFQDLDYGEFILNAVPLAGSLYVLTDKSIWKCTPSVDFDTGDVTLDCQRVYTEPRNQWGCLAYPNSLVSDGFSLWYLGRDNVYKYNPYQTMPETPEWINRASSIIFNKKSLKIAYGTSPETTKDLRIDRRSCESPIIELFFVSNDQEKPEAKEMHISWPTFQQLGGSEVVGECEPTTAMGNGVNNHTLVANFKASTCDYRDYGSTAMVNYRSDYQAVADCNQNVLFLCANGEDWCLKEMNRGYGRVMNAVGTGNYTTKGYFSIIRGVFPFDKFDAEKFIKSFTAEIMPIEPLDAVVARLRIGTAFVAQDPNSVNGKCGVIWHQLSDNPIKCKYKRTPEQYADENVRPFSDSDVSWSFYYRGKFLYYELKLANPDGSAPTTGGCAISRFETTVRLV